jgi:hypothetical protein
MVSVPSESEVPAPSVGVTFSTRPSHESETPVIVTVGNSRRLSVASHVAAG